MALPRVIQEIVDLIGHGAAMAIVGELGGLDFRFPETESGANWELLVELIGERLAKKLRAHFSGSEVYIAMCSRAVSADRNRRLIVRADELLREGHSMRGAVSILVGEFRPIAGRTIERILNSPAPSMAPEMEAQGSLF